ncbi:MAG: LPS assembly protein LptD, partial [Gammaproteobacteria bacterium]|nr:LPS assembly protein LptD [Gammaproteobacteria bacterium]
MNDTTDRAGSADVESDMTPDDTDGETVTVSEAEAGATAVTTAPVAPAVGTIEESDSQRWTQCPPAPLPAHLAGIDDPDTVDLQANSIHSSPDRVFTLSGDAMIRYDEQLLEAGNITYRRADGELSADDGVRFAGPNLVVTADSALIETAAERGRLENIAYSVPGQYARGHAGALGFEGTTRQYLEKASYTACPPGSPDWEMTAKKIELDQADGTGTARNAKVTFKDVPLLYTPYISFPLDDRRKSGLLFPKIGTTDETGLDVSLPWYWNIAPHRDLTLIPRLMTDRGVLFGGEFRYLNRRSRGNLSAEYLPSDKEFGDRDRNLVTLQHQGNPVPRLATRIEASNVSDIDYFEDLGNTLVQTSQTSLERTAEATWHGDSWQASFLVQDFQNVDSTLSSFDKPYKQLPQIVFSYTPQQRLLGIEASAAAELNYFNHSNSTRVTGSRIDIMPRLGLPIERPGWYIKPTAGVRHTVYQLENTAAGMPDDPSRTLPVATLDTGMVFERTGSWSGRSYIQTLEPRLFYLYIPDKNQDELPIFDTENYDQNFWSLFRENRFSGPDRIGDANQLAVALSSRIVDPASGRQLLSASIGSLLYFRDRTITLPGGLVETDSSSDVIGELAVALSRRWRVSGEAHWNPHRSQSMRNNYHLQYRAGPRQLLNIGYRFRDGLQEQADISFLWPIGRAWHAVGRWYYAMDDNETIEALAGLGYERCCWGIQVLGRSYINDDSLERNNAIFIQLELKGLGKL